MAENIKNYLAISLVAALPLFALAAFWYVAVFSKSVLPERSFLVSGEGKVVAVPDVAEMSFGVLTEGGKNLADLQKQNTQKINRVIGFLKEEGIDDKDVKTRFYNISLRYQSTPCPLVLQTFPEIKPCPPSEIIGYTVNQSVSVKIRDLKKAGDIVEGVVARGADTVSGPNFTIDDPAALQNQAREEAIKEAREKAMTLAKAGGFRLGKLISINEGFFFSPPIPFSLEDGRGGVGAGPSIEPGSQEVIVNVTLKYEIR